MQNFFNPLQKIDNILNSITMYRLILYALTFLSIIAILAGFLNLLSPFSGIEVLASLTILVLSCQATSFIISKIIKIPANTESSFITAFLLFFILIPGINSFELRGLILASIVAIASKYIFVFRTKHIFNPAAFSVFILGIFQLTFGFWWIGNMIFLPVVVITGMLIVRKLRKFVFVSVFILFAMLTAIFMAAIQNTDIFKLIPEMIISWPVLFFAFFMLTEPQTTPQSKKLQILFAVFTGMLFSSQINIANFVFASPELALVTANLVFFFINPKTALALSFKQRTRLADNIYEFSFSKDKNVLFMPGQYLEWTLPHEKQDQRGMRRFFTIASAPNEKQIKIGVRINNHSSAFKKALLGLNKDEKIYASGPLGDFTLENTKQKLVFIAGGIGITPFISMLKYLIHKNQKIDITLFYCSSDASEFVYKDVLSSAKKAGLKIFYVLTNPKKVPSNWNGVKGRLTRDIIKNKVGDYDKREFYLSGPSKMVDSYKKLLKETGISDSRIKTDYFSGY
jgi:glycine betaine catabolism B